MAPPILCRSVKPIPTKASRFCWHLQNFSPSGITVVKILGFTGITLGLIAKVLMQDNNSAWLANTCYSFSKHMPSYSYLPHRNYMVKSFRPYGIAYFPPAVHHCNEVKHGLRTPIEGINQRYLKNWADVADKICFGRIHLKIWGVGVNFQPCSDSYFLSG